MLLNCLYSILALKRWKNLNSVWLRDRYMFKKNKQDPILR